MKRKWLAFLLLAALLLSFLPAGALAAETEDEEEGLTYQTWEEAGVTLRNYLKERKTYFIIYLSVPDVKVASLSTSLEERLTEDFTNMWTTATKYTGVPDEGDYIAWQYDEIELGEEDELGYDVEMNGLTKCTVNFILPFRVTYYSDSLEESMVDIMVNQLLNLLPGKDASDYEKVKAVYDWITANVEYDTEHATNDDYKQKYSCYSAIIDRQSVAQGYSLLMYRLLLELGVDCRCVPGYLKEGETLSSHAWNAVKLEDKWYLCDATKDAGKTSEEYTCFLKSPDSLADHLSVEKLLEDEELLEESGLTKDELESSGLLLDLDYSDCDYTVVPVITKAENTGNGVRLTWNKFRTATQYSVCYRENGTDAWTEFEKTTGTTSLITGLTSGKTYDLSVKAYINDTWTDEATATTVRYGAFPVVSKLENAGNGIKVTWSAVDGATKYRVYYKISGASSYSKFGDVTTTSATVTGLTNGKSYVFTVKAYANSAWSSNKASSAFTYAAFPLVSKLANTSTGVKVTWSAVDGATKYRVYYKISGASSYTKFGDVTTTSATVTGLTAGKSYVFTVKAYANKAWSSNKASSAIVYRPIPTVTKLTNAAKGITVTWGKISGATKYALYYKVSGASSWTRVSNTLTTNSATVTGLTSGKSYVFTVKAYVGSGWSSNVSSSAIVRVNAVTLSGLTNSASKTMKATWKKDTTLTGYQIQYSLNSDFSSSKTVTVKSNTTVSQTIKSLTKGKTYYVRIRGYKTVSKVTTYGAWSASKSVKISK